MKNQDMTVAIKNYALAGYPAIFVRSHEEQRVEGEIKTIADAIKFRRYVWSITGGLVNSTTGAATPETQDPVMMLDSVCKLPEKSIIVLRDFPSLYLSEQGNVQPNPVLFRKLRDVLYVCKNSNRVLVIIGCNYKLPAELEKEIVIVEFSLPDRAKLLEVLNAVATSAGAKLKDVEAIIDAACGLTTIEAENAFALSWVEVKDILPEIVRREKCNTIKRNGLLEIMDNSMTLERIGGLKNLKRELVEKKILFTKEARDFGCDNPIGLLLVGQPGCGKTLCAKATTAIFGIPGVRLEAGRLFDKFVGGSESNWRVAHSTAKSLQPVVFFIDEVDGLFGSQSSASGSTDNGTADRVIKAILQDMQDDSEGIFYIFTCNDIDKLPSPLISRLETWSVELPSTNERKEIWSIHIAKKGRKPAKFDLNELASLTEGFDGRQIENAWKKTMNLACIDKTEPTMEHARTAISRFVPTSVTMKDDIERRRQRLLNCATPAGDDVEAPVQTGRKLVA